MIWYSIFIHGVLNTVLNDEDGIILLVFHSHPVVHVSWDLPGY
jgi:hypothetical protein